MALDIAIKDTERRTSMAPEDPRHGTHAGYQLHRRLGEDACQPCVDANAYYHRHLIYDHQRGRRRTVSSLGARRRIHALQRLGWSLRALAREGGSQEGNTESFRHTLKRDRVLLSTHRRVADMYDRLSMIIPTGPGTTRARRHAERQGWPPPLAYDDIDDPNEQPKGITRRSNEDRTRHHDQVDEVVILRVLAGEQLATTRAEREEILARHLTAGGNEHDLCERLGWREGRYTRRAVAA